MVLLLAGAGLAAVLFLVGILILRRAKEKTVAGRSLAIGRQIVVWLEYWFFRGVSPHLEQYIVILPGYEPALADKTGRLHRHLITITVAYDPNGIRFDIESMVRRQADHAVQTFFPHVTVYIRFQKTTSEELHNLRRIPVALRQETSRIDEHSTADATPIATSSRKAKVCVALFGNLGGTLGREIARAYDPDEVAHAHLGIFDLDKGRSDNIFAASKDPDANAEQDHLAAWMATADRFFRPDLGNGIGAGGSHDVAAQALEAIKAEVEQYIDGATLVIAVACPSGGSGGNIVPFAELVTQKGISLRCHLVRPFADDGDVSISRFLTAYQKLQAMPGVCITDHHNEYAFDPANPLASQFGRTSSMFKVLNEQAFRPSFEATLDLGLRVHDVLSRDLHDFVSVVSNSKRGYAYKLDLESFRREGGFDVDAIIQAVLNDRFQRPDVIAGASRALIMYSDELNPITEQRKITDAITRAMKNGAQMPIELRKGVTTAGKPSIIVFIGSDIPDPAPSIYPPWMAAGVQAVQPFTSVKLPVVAAPEPIPVAAVAAVPAETTRTMDIAIAEGVRGIRIQSYILPAELADRIASFAPRHCEAEIKAETPDDHHALRGGKEAEWKELQTAAQPYLGGGRMASLERIKFVNTRRSEITRHFTPLVGHRHREFMAACGRQGGFASTAEATTAFEALNADFMAEVGQRIDPTASQVIRRALGMSEPATSPRKIIPLRRGTPEGERAET